MGFAVGHITGDWIRIGLDRPARTSPRDPGSLGSTLVSPTRLADSAEFAESLVMQYSVMKELPREYAKSEAAQWGICFMTRGRGKAEHPTPNIQHPTSNTQHPITQAHCRRLSSIGCWVLDVRLFRRTSCLPHPLTLPGTPPGTRAWAFPLCSHPSLSSPSASFPSRKVSRMKTDVHVLNDIAYKSRSSLTEYEKTRC